MNDTIIRNHNQRVKPDDIVFHVGDFCFRNSSERKGEGTKIKAIEYEKQLNGKIIHIRGNHDKNNSTKTIIESLIIKFAGKLINLTHRPENFNSNYDINFVGHIHQLWKFKRIKTQFTYVDLINVGVDVWDFMPITFEEIMRKYKYWKRINNYL